MEVNIKLLLKHHLYYAWEFNFYSSRKNWNVSTCFRLQQCCLLPRFYLINWCQSVWRSMTSSLVPCGLRSPCKSHHFAKYACKVEHVLEVKQAGGVMVWSCFIEGESKGRYERGGLKCLDSVIKLYWITACGGKRLVTASHQSSGEICLQGSVCV